MTTRRTDDPAPSIDSPAGRHSAATTALAGVLLASACLALPGCATGPNADPRDPFEPFNRGVTKFNDGLDEAVLKPVATTYKKVTPDFVRTGVSNFFGNLGDAWSAVNSVLQAKPQAAAENIMRFSFNTVFGFGGVLDIASEMRIERHKEDFGQTLGRWGVPTGPYLVLPVFGPSTVRDTAGFAVDTQGDLVNHIDHIPTRNSLYALRVVDKRASLLRATGMLNDVALDKYSFTRDVYLQLRNNEVNDGKLPDDNDGASPPPPADAGGKAPAAPAPQR